MRRLAVFFAIFVLVASAGAAARSGSVPPFPRLPGAWSHAEINVTIRKKPHTLILDRGRITQVSGTQLTLRERDGSIAVIPLSVQTIVVIDGFRATSFDLRRKMTAETMRIDGGAAVRVRAVF